MKTLRISFSRVYDAKVLDALLSDLLAEELVDIDSAFNAFYGLAMMLLYRSNTGLGMLRMTGLDQPDALNMTEQKPQFDSRPFPRLQHFLSH